MNATPHNPGTTRVRHKTEKPHRSPTCDPRVGLSSPYPASAVLAETKRMPMHVPPNHKRARLVPGRRILSQGTIVSLAVLFVLLVLGVGQVREPWAVLAIFLAFHMLGATAATMSGWHAWRALGGGSRAARAGIVIAGATIVGMIGLSANAQLPDLVRLVGDDAHWPPSDVRVTADGAVIEISGPLRWSVVGRLRDALARTPHARAIRLDSPGGRIGVGLELHEIVRAHGLDTVVVGGCASACTDVFLAGRRRWAAEEAKLGFHQGAIGGAVSRLIDAGATRLYTDAGVAADFIARVLAVGGDGMWVPQATELRAARVVTDRAEPGRYPLGFN